MYLGMGFFGENIFGGVRIRFFPLIIYYKTLFVKERLHKPFSHNDDFFGAIFPQKAEKVVVLPRKWQKRGGYAHVTPHKGIYSSMVTRISPPVV